MFFNLIAAIFICLGIIRVTIRLVKRVTLSDVLYLLFWLTLIASFFVETKLYLIIPLGLLVVSHVVKNPDHGKIGDFPGSEPDRPKRFKLSEPPKQQPIGRPSDQLDSESGPDLQEEREVERVDESPEDFIHEIPKVAEECVRMTKALLKEDLDYSPESLEIVDRLITETWNGEYVLPIDGLAVQFGSYTGEVIRRNLGGTWAYSEGSYVLLDVQSIKVAYVFSKAYRRLKDGEDNSLAFFYRAMKAMIEREEETDSDS